MECVVTERFTLKAKDFYDEEIIEPFRDEYAAIPLYEKAMENKLLAEMIHVSRLEEISELCCVDRSLWATIYIQADRRQLVKEHERATV